MIPDVNHKGEGIRSMIIENIHKIVGHYSHPKTLKYMRNYYWWPTMAKDMEKFCKSCETCQTSKRRTSKPHGLLHNLPIPDHPWSGIAMDFIGPFPESLGKNYLWVVICCLMSQVHLIPINTTIKTLNLANEFLIHIVRLHGLPNSIMSDCDTKFTSMFWKELHQLLGVKLNLSTSFHPQMDGQTECMIQNIIQILRTTVHPDQCDWVLKILMTEFAINSSVNKSMGFAPFELIYGYLPYMTLSIPASEYKGVQEFAQQALYNLQATHDAIIMSHVKQTIQLNKHRSQELIIKEGDLIYLSTKELKLPKG